MAKNIRLCACEEMCGHLKNLEEALRRQLNQNKGGAENPERATQANFPRSGAIHTIVSIEFQTTPNLVLIVEVGGTVVVSRSDILPSDWLVIALPIVHDMDVWRNFYLPQHFFPVQYWRNTGLGIMEITSSEITRLIGMAVVGDMWDEKRPADLDNQDLTGPGTRPS